MTEATSLANHLLIAMPSMNDSLFKQAVIYICEHHETGAIGLIINRPMEYPMKFVFDQMNLSSDKKEINEMPLMFGGPVQSERGFVLHRPGPTFRSSLQLSDDVCVTTSNDIIQSIAANKGPQDALVILGYAAWEMHELEDEVKKNAWMVCPFKQKVLYDSPFSERWNEAGLSIGVHMNALSTDLGHA